jgi:hypothetical protein
MTCWIGADPRPVGPRPIVELRSPEGEHDLLGSVEVVDPEMQVKLHRRRRIRPRRRLMARRSLERQVEVCLLALAYRAPVRLRANHRPPRDPAVELRERGGVAALQGDPTQPSNTAHTLQATRRSAPRRCPTLTCVKRPWGGIEATARRDDPSDAGSRSRRLRQAERRERGSPTATTFGGRSFVTIDPAPTTVFSPIVTPGRTMTSAQPWACVRKTEG